MESLVFCCEHSLRCQRIPASPALHGTGLERVTLGLGIWEEVTYMLRLSSVGRAEFLW